MNLAAEFSAWVQDPCRTNDELFLAELLVEAGHQQWRAVTHAPWSSAYHHRLDERRKQRALDPAYRARLSRKKIGQTVEVWPQILRLLTTWGEDFPVRDLAALRFFPQLEELEIQSALKGLAGLAVLTRLRKLKIDDDELADLSELARHPQLTDLTLKLDWPWPALASLAQLPNLKQLVFTGNILAFAEVPRLPAVEKAQLGYCWRGTLPVREVAQLPDMPCVCDLQIGAVASLRGLERYSSVEKLALGGPFADLTPIAALPNLRELALHGDRFRDLAPLARLPRLRTLKLDRERGLDLTPLSDSPSLRQVKSDCKVLATELATLNAALGFIDESDFLAPEPRPARPLRYLSSRPNDPESKAEPRKDVPDERTAVFGDDPLMGPAEYRWFKKRVDAALAPFGDPKWIETGDLNHMLMVKLFRAQEADRVVEMIAVLQPLIRAARFDWGIFIMVECDGDPEEDEWEIPDRSVFDAEREREEWEEQRQRWKEHELAIEREHLMNLQPPTASAPGESAVVADEDELDDTDNQAAEVSRTEEEEADDEDFVDDRSFRIWLDGDIAWLREDELEDARDFLRGAKIEDWHRLPEPRPRLRGW